MKMRKILIAVFLMAVFAAAFVSASIESSKNSYLTTEEVYVRSTATLCNNLPTDENVSLYIVENRDEWSGGEFLDEVRDEVEEVPNAQFSPRKIWDAPKAGFYDIIVDCTGNEEYDSLEPIDGLFNVGFEVMAVTGGGSAKKGSKDAGDSVWMYDPEDPDLVNEILQLALLAADEDIILENITIQASGTADDTEIEVEVFADENNDGKAEEDEIIISDTELFPEDDGLLVMDLDYVLTRDQTENILIVYRMDEDMEEGDFSLRVDSLYGFGENSDALIKFSGLPLNSGTKTILPPKTCVGELNLDLDPNPVPEESEVLATMDGLTNCKNKTIVLRENPCGSSIQEDIDSCVIAEGAEGCEISFLPSASKTYHACMDKNEDEDMIDFGEYDFEDLVITGKMPETNLTEVNLTETNVSEDNFTLAPITGGAIDEFREQLSEAGSFFILLEITLLLILFVLIMIMFRLKPAGKKKKKEKKEEEEEEEEED